MRGEIGKLRDAVIGEIKRRMPGLKRVEGHGGRFNAAELRRLGGRTPAVLVSVLGVGRGKEVGSGETDWPAEIGAFVVTGDTRPLDRDLTAVNLAEALITLLPGQAWGRQNAHPVMAGDIREARNLYSAALDGQGVALWLVAWTQTLRLGADIWASNESLPPQWYLGQDPNIGAAHLGDYDRIG